MQNFKQIFKAFLLTSILLLVSCTEISPSSYYVESVSEPIINLNGDWKISLNLSNEYS